MVNKSPPKINFHGIPNYYWSEAPLENDYFVDGNIILDSQGYILLTGYQRYISQNWSESNGYLGKFNSSGELIWNNFFGTAEDEERVNDLIILGDAI